LVRDEVGMNKHRWVSVTYRPSKPHADIELKEVIKWCEDTFGKGGNNEKHTWRYGWRHYDVFHFKFEKDALFFTMRWL